MEILVADDSIITQKLMQVVLNQLGYSFDIVNNGQEAINEFHKKVYDYIFLDLNMPIKSGLEAAKEMIQIKPDTKIILISGEKISEQKNLAGKVKFYGYLEKPFSINDIQTILNGSPQ